MSGTTPAGVSGPAPWTPWDGAATRVAELLAQRAVGCGPRLVAVDGPSGAGKTTFAGVLATRLGGCPLVHMDDLYPGWDGLLEAQDRLREWVVDPLAAGQRARFRRYDWEQGRYGPWHDVPPCDVVVLEGVGAACAAVADRLDVVVWVGADRAVRRARGLARDGEAYRPHWQRWATQEDAYFAADPVRERADVVCDTTSWAGSLGGL